MKFQGFIQIEVGIAIGIDVPFASSFSCRCTGTATL